MKTTSAGTVIINEFDEILVGKVTAHNPVRFDLPKGMIEDGETPLHAAIRECKEEFGYDLNEDRMCYVRHFNYNKQKNLELYLYPVLKGDIDMGSLHCETTFNRHGRDFPEMCGYAWIPVTQINETYFCKSMVKVLTIAKFIPEYKRIATISPHDDMLVGKRINANCYLAKNGTGAFLIRNTDIHPEDKLWLELQGYDFNVMRMFSCTLSELTPDQITV